MSVGGAAKVATGSVRPRRFHISAVVVLNRADDVADMAVEEHGNAITTEKETRHYATTNKNNNWLSAAY